MDIATVSREGTKKRTGRSGNLKLGQKAHVTVGRGGTDMALGVLKSDGL